MPSLTISSFAKGWKDDPALDPDKIYSLKRLVNADIDYERGASRRRKGYKRYHSTNLPGLLKQCYEFVDTKGQTRLLAIAKSGSNYRLYLVEANENNEIKNYSVTDDYPLGKRLLFDSHDNYPFKTVGDRVFFSDDNDWYWTDYSSAKKGAGPYTYECYQAGIDKPTFLPTLTATSSPGYDDTDITGIVLTETGLGSKLAQSFQVSINCVIDGVRLYSGAWGYTGDVIVRIETDDAGSPSGTLVNPNAYGRLSLGSMPQSTSAWNVFSCVGNFSLTASTTYWIVVDGDVTYDANYDVSNYFSWDYKSPGGYALGKAIQWTGSAWQDIANTDFNFRLGGGLTYNKTYQYKFTNYNSVYAIESEPDEDFLAVYTGSKGTFNITTLSAPQDEQVDRIRIYRTKQLDNSNENASYYLVQEIDDSQASFWDMINDDNLGSELQTTDHLRLADANGTLLIPRYLEHWQNRLWAVPNNSKTLYYSKQLEERGSLGVSGDAIYDYYPADNKWTLDSKIRAIRLLEDRLIVYTSNNNVHIFDGANSPLNPPGDLAHQELIVGDNCYDDRSLAELMGRHIFVTANKQVKAFNGSNILEPISKDNIQQSMDRSGDKYSAVVYKNQYVLAVDTDSDDIMDVLYILDLSGRLPAWRSYQYLDHDENVLGIYNLFVTSDAKLFVATAQIDDNVFRIIQLDDGYSDDWTSNESDGIDITMTLQTQYIIPARRAKWTRFSMKGYYPQGALYGEDYYQQGYYGGDAVIPTLTLSAFGKENYFITTTLAPTSSDDVRGHTCGLRLASEECSIRLDSKGDKLDEIREITFEWRF